MAPQSQLVDWSLSPETLSEDVELVRICSNAACRAVNPAEAIYCHADGARLKSTQAIDPFETLRRACQRPPLDWMLISLLAQEAEQAGHALPPDLAPFNDEATRRLGCFAVLGAMLEQNDLRGVVDVYDPALIDDWFACAEMAARSREAIDALKNLEQLQSLLKNPGDGLALLALWDQAEPDLSKWAGVVEPIREQVLPLQTRNLAWNNLESLCRSSTSDRAIVQAWQTLKKCGGHPKADTVHARVDLADRRVDCLEKLPSQQQLPSEELDGRIVRIWDVALLKDCAEARPLRSMFETAGRRLAILSELDRIVSQVDAGVLPEDAILEKAALPKGYPHRLEDRVAKARARQELKANWETVVGRTKQSDREIASAWTHAVQGGVRLDAVAMKRGKLAVERAQRLGQIEAVACSLPLDEQDRRWEKLWNEPLFQGCGDADPYRKRHEEALLRIGAWRALREAMKEKDYNKIIALSSKSSLKNYPPLVNAREELKGLLEIAKILKRTRELLARNDFNAFLTQLDLEFLRGNSELFTAEREAIESAVSNWLHENSRIAPADPASKSDPYSGLLVVRWTWQHFQLISRCQVALHPSSFFQTHAEGADHSMRWDAEAHRRAGGGVLVPPMGKSRVCVTVWPVVDLGWKEVFGPPLHLGPFRTPSPKRF